MGKLHPENFICKAAEPASSNSSSEMVTLLSNITALHEIPGNESAKMCGPPEKLNEYLTYRRDYGQENGNEAATKEGGFISGTEIQFSCISSAMGDRKTWKIVCDSGVWVGRATECGKY